MNYCKITVKTEQTQVLFTVKITVKPDRRTNSGGGGEQEWRYRRPALFVAHAASAANRRVSVVVK